MVAWFNVKANQDKIPHRNKFTDGFDMGTFWSNCCRGTNLALFATALASSTNMKAQYDKLELDYFPGVLENAKKEYRDANHTKPHSDWKDKTSDFFAEKAKASGGPVVYFDGDHLRTTYKLLEQNIDADMLYVANPDENICQRLQEMGVNVFCGYFEENQWDMKTPKIAFTAAYLDTTYAKIENIETCINKLLSTTDACKFIGFTMLPRAKTSVHSRLNKLNRIVGDFKFQCPIGEDDTWYSDHGNVYTRFFPRIKETKRTYDQFRAD